VSRQNIYDDERFFGSYQRMRRAQTGLNEALEQPSMLELLPTVRGAVVLDLGCGDGALSRELANRGAAQVTGVDPSGRMLGLARRRTADDRITYLRAFAEDLDLPDASFDLVVSSLAFHYLSGESFHTLVNAIARWLRPDGTIVASMVHPVKTAAPDAADSDQPPVGDYADEGPRLTHWFRESVVKHHRTTATILNTFIDAGLVIECVLEPAPTRAAIDHRPDLAVHRRRPPLLILRARPASSLPT
jgi:ubiquinone/menaquinone biosynthesis C-methylase UbiE